MALEKTGKLREFLSPTIWPPCKRPHRRRTWNGLTVFARWRQYALPSNTCFLGPTHWGHPCPHPKRHLNRFSRVCTAHGKQSLYFTMGRSLRLKIASLHDIKTPI